ncbi:MAG: lasso peptide [Cyanobacteria bacterium J06643_13]
MKKAYSRPQLTVHGSVNVLTQQTKGLGSDDGVILTIPGLTPPDGVPIGPLS